MDQVEEVKSKVDLVDVISSYVPLKKMGRNMGGLCPFHGEKTPSFMVSPERQSWKCFGCGEGGDVFTFLEKIEGWDFREVLEELAKRAGVTLQRDASSKGGQIKEKILEANELALKFYSHILNKHPLGKIARDYLDRRGVDQELWQKFDLGFAPNSWDNVSNFLQKKGFSVSDIGQSGLVVGREGARGQSRTTAFYDRFRGRVMFPIKDIRGKIMGFSGRVLGTDKQAKYINSPETVVFHKGNLLFGLDLARSAIRSTNEAVLVEGEFDVISAHKAGVENTVASKGTALTEMQVKTISRLCENVVLCFDMDIAGDAASRRGIELLDAAGLNIKIAKLEGVKDPDEFAQKDPKGFKTAIKSSLNVYDYLIDSALSRFDAKTAIGKKKIGAEILPILSKISDDLTRAHYATKLAKSLDLEVSFINEAIENKRSNIGDGVQDSQPNEVKVARETSLMEDYFLALFITGEMIMTTLFDKIQPRDFESEQAARFWETVRDIIRNSKPKQKTQLVKLIPKEFGDFVDHLFFVSINERLEDQEAWAQEILEVALRIKKGSIKRDLLSLSELLKKAQSTGDEKTVSELSERFDKLSLELKGETL